MRKEVKIILILILFFFIALIVFFVLDQTAIQNMARERNVTIQYEPGADENCLDYIPKVNLQYSQNEINEQGYFLKLIISYDENARDTVFSGVLEGKKEKWEVFYPLSKRFFTFQNVELPLKVEEPLMVANKNLLEQGYQSIRAEYLLKVLGCAEISGYTNELELKNTLK